MYTHTEATPLAAPATNTSQGTPQPTLRVPTPSLLYLLPKGLRHYLNTWVPPFPKSDKIILGKRSWRARGGSWGREEGCPACSFAYFPLPDPEHTKGVKITEKRMQFQYCVRACRVGGGVSDQVLGSNNGPCYDRKSWRGGCSGIV